MATTIFDTTTDAALGPRRPSLAERLIRFLRRTAQELRLRNAARTLAQMSDEHLSDIGIARGDIEDAIRNGRPWRDAPRRRS